MNVLTIDPIVSKESLGAKAPIFDISASCLSIAAIEPPSETHADISAQLLMPPTIEESPHCTDIATTAVASSTAVLPALPVHIYPKAAFDLLKLKCPLIRSYLDTDINGAIGEALVSGLNCTLAPFEGGQEVAHRACSSASDFSQKRFDEDMAAGRASGMSQYSCAQALADGSTKCPTGGCPLPNAKIASAPTDLLIWNNCNLADVGHLVIAQSVAASEYGSNIVSVRDKLHAYHAGIYPEIDSVKLNRKILRHLGVKGKLKNALEIGKLLIIQCARPLESITPNPDYICFENGTLNVKTKSLQPHNPAHTLLNRIPHPYIANAACEQFIAFLNSVWAGDRDRHEKIQLIRQWIGYLLVADSSMQKMLILKGEGANGKSVIVDLIRELVGETNTSNAMLDRLRQAYVRATMEGKLLNESADLPKKGLTPDGELKALIAGDAIEVSPKFKPSHTIKPYVRFMVATNNMPDCKDTSDGYFRRLMILTFNRQFAEHERNPHLLGSLIPEIPGIIAWALEGLYELREQGRFSIPPSSEQAVSIYRNDIDPVRLFAEECLVASTDRSGFLPRDLFMAYRAWCRDRGFDAGNMVTFGRQLSVLGFDQRKSGNTWWLVSAKEAGQEYFRPAVIVPDNTPPLPSSELLLVA